jgi:nucleotide-binding universal stress UspA family protein
MERDGLPTGLDSTAMQELRILATEIGATECCCGRVEPRVVHGNPSIEILSASAELHASVIVLEARNRPAYQSLTRDRTVYRVLAHARCPVLTLREPSEAAQDKSIAHLASHG